MPMPKKDESDKFARVTITLDKDIYQKLVEYSKIECLPVSRVIARILKRFFEMR